MSATVHPPDHATDRPLASPELHAELGRFLALESELIDSRHFREWLRLVADDFTYAVPVPFTPDNPEALPYDPSAFVIDETRDTLVDHWFRRYEEDMWETAWAENPPVRYRHFVSNVRVRPTDREDLYDVRSNVIVSAARQGDLPTLLVAERFDEVERAGDGWRLKRRYVVLDATLIDFAQMRVVL